MSTILLVEDNPHIMKINAEALTMYGYEILQAATARECRQALRWHPVDLVVLDIMLPDGDGVELCRELKEQYHTPILFLSALGESRDVVEGLRAGGDDYLAKPFSMAELIARVHAQLRRASCAAEPTVLTVEDLTLDLISRKVVRGGERIELQPLEYQLLEYLMRNKGRVVSKNTIMEHVWEYHFDTRTNIVESRVCRLREKIDKPFARKLIRTVRGFGYVLE